MSFHRCFLILVVNVQTGADNEAAESDNVIQVPRAAEHYERCHDGDDLPHRLHDLGRSGSAVGDQDHRQIRGQIRHTC